jgi:hypothetical protein
MDVDEARDGLAEIRARQAQVTAEAARWRWPRWYVAATAALMLAVSAGLDAYHDAALFIVVYCCGISLLQVPLTRRPRLRPRYTLAVAWPLGVLPIVVAAVYVLVRLALGAAGAPLPSTIAGVVMAGAYVAGLATAQQVTARRLAEAR